MDTRTGPQHAIVIAALIQAPTCIFFVALRCIARHRIRAFGTDDWLMLAALTAFIPACAFALFAGYDDFAGPHGNPNVNHLSHVLHALFIFSPIQAIALSLARSSICFTLLRFATRATFPKIRKLLYCLLALIGIAGLVAMIAPFTYCRPISAAWEMNLGNSSCISKNIVSGITYFISATSLLVDFSCAVLPTFIVWKVKMKLRTKIMIAFILSVGLVASAGVIIRLQILGELSATTGLVSLFRLSQWSVVECGFGITAGCFSTLKPLGKIFTGPKSMSTTEIHEMEAGLRPSTSQKLSASAGSCAKSQTRVEEVGTKACVRNSKGFARLP